MAHTLLLADDSVTIQRVIELTFADEDIDVVAVGDGDQAIARLNGAPRPDIVLADIGMPGKTGYEVADYIKHSPELSHIPVVLLTGAFEPVDQERAAAVECDAVLAKPFEPQLVIGRVKELLARPRPAGMSKSAAAPPSTAAEVEAGTHAAAAPETHQRAPVAGLDEYFDRLDAAFASLSSAGRAAIRGETAVPAQAPERIDHPMPQLAEADLAAPPTPGAGVGPVPSPAPTTAPFAAAPPAADQGEPVVSPAGPDAPPDRASQPVDVDASRPLPTIDSRSAPSAPPATLASPAPAATLPSLVDAFAALLAAERTAPSPDTPPAWPARAVVPAARVSIGEDDLERLVEQVTRRVLDRMSDRAVRETVGDTVSTVAERLVRDEIERIKRAIK